MRIHYLAILLCSFMLVQGAVQAAPPLAPVDKSLVKELFLDGLINESADALIAYGKDGATVNGYHLDDEFLKKYRPIFGSLQATAAKNGTKKVTIARDLILSTALADSDILHHWVIKKPDGQELNLTKGGQTNASSASVAAAMQQRRTLAGQLLSDRVIAEKKELRVHFTNRDAGAPIVINGATLTAAQQKKYYPILRQIMAGLAGPGRNPRAKVWLVISRDEFPS